MSYSATSGCVLDAGAMQARYHASEFNMAFEIIFGCSHKHRTPLSDDNCRGKCNCNSITVNIAFGNAVSLAAAQCDVVVCVYDFSNGGGASMMIEAPIVMDTSITINNCELFSNAAVSPSGIDDSVFVIVCGRDICFCCMQSLKMVTLAMEEACPYQSVEMTLLLIQL